MILEKTTYCPDYACDRHDLFLNEFQHAGLSLLEKATSLTAYLPPVRNSTVGLRSTKWRKASTAQVARMFSIVIRQDPIYFNALSK